MTLTQASTRWRKGVKTFIIVFVGYYIATLAIFPVIGSFIKAITPERDPANPLYGVLDPLEFVEKAVDNPNYEIVLNTKDGRLPSNLPNKLPVYKFKLPKFSYAAGKNAKADAAAFGFTDSDLTTDLKGNIYKWRNIETDATLEINIDTRELKANTYLANKQQLFGTRVTNSGTAQGTAKSLLTSIDRFSDEGYSKGTQTVVLGKFGDNGFVETKSPFEAQLAIVDFFRNIENYKIVGPDPKVGLMRIYTKAADPVYKTLNYPIASLYYWEVDPQTNATYPLVNIREAWNAVKQRKGVIANVSPKAANAFAPPSLYSVSKILVNNIYIAYYETPKLQKLLQPIYVFEGNYTSDSSSGDITIYFPAVRGDFVKQPTAQTGSQE